MEQVKSSDTPRKRQFPDTEAQSALKDEILHLRKQLEEQLLMRSALEKALSHRSLFRDFTYESAISEPAKDLIREITLLELEVKYLEKYLLTMYRKILGKRSSSFSTGAEGQEIPEPGITPVKANPVANCSDHARSQSTSQNPPNEGSDDILGSRTLMNYGVHRSQSSLSQHSVRAFRSSPLPGSLSDAVHSCQSLPLTMLELRDQDSTSNHGLPGHLFGETHDRAQQSPNLLSEEMIKCISAIYFHLADPPLSNHGFPTSPISIVSSTCELSPQAQQDICVLEFRENPWSNNHSHVPPSAELKGSFPTLAEVHGIRRDKQSLHIVEHMLENFRHLVSRLEEVDVRRLKHDQKLAFWVNVHNALVMHAHLVYGIQQSNLKRISLILKAAYNIGGHTISNDMIQRSILGCRLPCPGQWLQSLFFPRTRNRAGAYLKAYAIEHPEPRLYFALCSGSHSDPSVRVYTPKSIFQELEMAKEEYIQTTIRLLKGRKLTLPKLVDSFAKDSSLCSSGLADMVKHYLPDCQGMKMQQPQQGAPWKKLIWSPHNFTFRVRISNELS